MAEKLKLETHLYNVFDEKFDDNIGVTIRQILLISTWGGQTKQQKKDAVKLSKKFKKKLEDVKDKIKEISLNANEVKVIDDCMALGNTSPLVYDQVMEILGQN